MKISFIVLTYNRTDALLPVLRSLSSQCGEDDEVVIADDGSQPEQVAMLLNACPAFKCSVRHVWHPDVGFTAARARNLGASLATADYLVFLDGDCVPGPHFVVQHARLAEPGCFVNGSRVLISQRLTERVVNGAIDLPSRPVWFWIRARLVGDSNKLLHLLRWPRRLLRVKQGFQWHGIRSCNLGVWRSDFASVNGFDETFQGWGHEDADLVLRLSHKGIRRKNGFMGTEVFHLWHRENKRDQESINKKRVFERMKTAVTQAEIGLNQMTAETSLKITHLY